MGSSGRSPYFSSFRNEDESRNDALTSALLGSSSQAQNSVDFQSQIEDKEINRLEQQLNYYKKRSEQRKRERKVEKDSGLNEALKSVSDYRRFGLK